MSASRRCCDPRPLHGSLWQQIFWLKGICIKNELVQFVQLYKRVCTSLYKKTSLYKLKNEFENEFVQFLQFVQLYKLVFDGLVPLTSLFDIYWLARGPPGRADSSDPASRRLCNSRRPHVHWQGARPGPGGPVRPARRWADAPRRLSLSGPRPGRVSEPVNVTVGEHHGMIIMGPGPESGTPSLSEAQGPARRRGTVRQSRGPASCH